MKLSFSSITGVLIIGMYCGALFAERVPSQAVPRRQSLDKSAAAGKSKNSRSLASQMQEDAPAPTDKELEAAIADELFDSPPSQAPGANPNNSPFSTTPSAATMSSIETSLSLAESFSAEKNPGKGSFTYKKVDQTEVIDLGTESGQFGFGLVFRHATLPEEFLRSYGKQDIIQFSFGTLPGKAEGRVPEFATMALFTKVKPKEWQSYPLMVGVQRQPGQEFGLVLFTTPRASAERSDEEKLRETFFARGGQVRLKSNGAAKGLDVDAGGKKVSFKVQAMKLEIEAELATPFNAQKNQLQGSVEIPVYWPDSPAALNWMKKIAFQSLLASNSVATARASASDSAPAKKARKSRRRSGE
jgi:hypothetical protein